MSTTSAPRRLRGHELLAAVAEGTAGAVGEEFLRPMEASEDDVAALRIFAARGGTRVHASIPLAG